MTWLFGKREVKYECPHTCKITGTSYLPPNPELLLSVKNNLTPYGLDITIRGVTSIYQMCEACGEIKRTKQLGEFKPPSK